MSRANYTAFPSATDFNTHEGLQRHLASGHSITPLQALRKFGIGRLAARIHGLRRKWKIRSAHIDVLRMSVKS